MLPETISNRFSWRGWTCANGTAPPDDAGHRCVSYGLGRAGSSEEPVDGKPDPRPGGHREGSKDDEESAQIAAGLVGLRDGLGVHLTRACGKRTDRSGFVFDNTLAEDQERPHVSIVGGEPDAVSILLSGVRLDARPQEKCRESPYNTRQRVVKERWKPSERQRC